MFASRTEGGLVTRWKNLCYRTEQWLNTGTDYPTKPPQGLWFPVTKQCSSPIAAPDLNIWLKMKKELPPTGANGSWLLPTDCSLLQEGNLFVAILGREGRIFSLRLRCRNCKLVMKEYFQCLVKPWQLGNKRNCEKKENGPESIVLTGSSLTDYRGTVVSPVMGSRPRVGTAVSILSPSSIHYRASFGTARKPAVIWFRIL